MPPEVFVDSSAWIAVTVETEQYHRVAIDAYRLLLQRSIVLITTNLAISEAYISIRRHGGHAAAVRFLESIRQSPRVIKVYSDEALEADAEQILLRHADQDFSFVDAVSFAVMHSRGIADAFAFDHHFQTAGFTVIPAAK